MKSLLPLFAGLLTLAATAQTEGLPHTLAPHEVDLIPAYRASRAAEARGITSPPAFPVRTMAEWEEVQSLVITWTSFTGILKQIVRYAKEECEVIIVCSNAANVISYLNNTSFGGPLPDLNNITFLVKPYNSIWVRDYGPETIYRNEVDSVMLLDWLYNRPRPLDDAVSDELATYKGIPIYSTTAAPYDLVHTGGNFMADGFGTAFSSELVDEENGPFGDYNTTVRTSAGVDSMMHWFMGIQPGRYIKLTQLLYDNINHIDMHMKLLDEETLLVGEFPAGLSDGPQIEQNIQYILNNYNSVFGTPYRLVRVPMPPSTTGSFPPNASYRTYANNIFINKTVLVPTYREQYDTTGLRILRESLPGYRVIGIDCDDSGQNIIGQSGAIHCITKAIGVDDPLLISHQRLQDTYDAMNPYLVDAYIKHRTGIAGAELYWTTDTTAGYSPVAMTSVGGDHWEALIPAHPAGTEIYYYIHATANSGKEQVRPIVAPQGWWRFRVLDVSTGLADVNRSAITSLYPNPAMDLLITTLEVAAGRTISVEILDASGRSVKQVWNAPMPSDGRVFVSVAGLAPGVYTLVVAGAHGRSSARFAKQ
ncbi:MAG: agmatine deiminase family protein [Flavobacteriales bacterium]|nr:agmatine deiminase family protein [Flavobacteriales bacterium]